MTRVARGERAARQREEHRGAVLLRCGTSCREGRRYPRCRNRPAHWAGLSICSTPMTVRISCSSTARNCSRSTTTWASGSRRPSSTAREAVRAALAERGLGLKRFIGDEPLADPPLRALSLAVAERCNLGCTYCYADGGSFGGPARDMPWEVAEASVRRLFAAGRARRTGHPRLSRRRTAGQSRPDPPRDRARGRIAGERSIPIRFSITTNGTLLTADDAEFFERYGFAVTVSLDGVGAVHDRQRPTKGGRGSYDRVIANVRPLLARQRRMQVSARVTVTPGQSRPARDARSFHRLGFPLRRLFAHAERAHPARRDAGARSRRPARRDDRMRARVRAQGLRRRGLSVRQHDDGAAGDSPRHAPPLPVRCRRGLFRRLRLRRPVRVPSLRRGRSGLPWAMSTRVSIEISNGVGWPSAWSTGRNRAGAAGHAISAVAAATTR